MFATPEDFQNSLIELPEPNQIWIERAKARQAQLTKPPGSLGRLEDLALFLAGWGDSSEPNANNATVVIFAGNHGVTQQNVSPYPPEVTAQMVENFKNKGAAINAITDNLNIGLSVVPLDLDRPTGDISEEAALDDNELIKALNIGAQSIPDGTDILCLGEMGIGNATIASALAMACFGGTGQDWAGAGTGLDDKGIQHKADVINKSVARYRKIAEQKSKESAYDILKHLGGREMAALTGAVIAARLARIPVVLDGFVVTSSVAPLLFNNKNSLKHCLCGHLSAEFAHKRLLKEMDLTPLLQLDMRLGEGTGAALAVALLRSAAATHNMMATFEQAHVKNRDDL